MRYGQFLVLWSLSFTIQPARAESISNADRAYLVAHLEMTREFVIQGTGGLTKDQWLFKPGPLRWSVAQCIDHLAATEEYVVKMVRERVLTAAEPLAGAFPSIAKNGLAVVEKPHPMSKLEDAIVLRWMTDRTLATQTPVEQRPPIEEVAPRETFADPQSALEHFLAVRAATIQYAKTTADDLRGHFTQVALGPGFSEMKFHDGYQWLLRMSAHTERHLIQVQEVQRSTGYPSGPPRTIR